MILTIYHMSGAGNTFSVIDNREHKFSHNLLQQLSILLCNQNEINSFATEGFIAIENHIELDFKAVFFNPDGSFGAMCGNGGRCAVQIAGVLGIIKPALELTKFEMASDIFDAKRHEDGQISVYFEPAKQIKTRLTIIIGGKDITLDYIDVGSDHAVIDYDDLAFDYGFRDFDINSFSRPIRYSADFGSGGVNVNVYKVIDNIVHLRTYERGVEAETGACGTGSISTALSASGKHHLDFPVQILPPSGIPLTVAILRNSSEEIEKIILTGPTEITDTIKLDIPDNLLINDKNI